VKGTAKGLSLGAARVACGGGAGAGDSGGRRERAAAQPGLAGGECASGLGSVTWGVPVAGWAVPARDWLVAEEGDRSNSTTSTSSTCLGEGA
jgi:hypothetical protein